MTLRTVCLGMSTLLLPMETGLAQRVSISASADSVFVGERFAVGLSVEHEAGGVVSFPSVPAGDPEAGAILEFGDAEVFATRRLPPELGSPARVDGVVYEAATFALDSAVVGPFEIRYVVGEDTTILSSGTITLPVHALVTADETELLPPLPPLPFRRAIAHWITLGVLGLLIAGLLVWLWRRSGGRGGSPRPEPYAEAVHRLERLRVPDHELAVKPFYVELSDLLRTYLSRSLGASALEQTTQELTDWLQDHRHVSDSTLKNIRGTLRVADLVKFADRRPDAEASALALDKARATIEAIESARQQREDPPTETPPEGDDSPDPKNPGAKKSTTIGAEANHPSPPRGTQTS